VTIREALRAAAGALASAGSDESALEAELLLAHALKTDRAHVYQRLGEDLSGEGARAFDGLVARRLAHEPTAYIMGRREFYGLELEVTPAAIIPRPETETLVELVLEFARPLERPCIVDVGVGCGAIAVALAVNLPEAEVIAIDVSAEALGLARRNAKRHGLAGRMRFLEGDLLAPLEGPVDVIAANLPYVRTEDFEGGPPEIREHEPRLGLDGGADGLHLIERLLRAAAARMRPGGALFAEIGDGQGEAVSALARECFPAAWIEVAPDLAGLDRVLIVRT
jgi:release factor glutamine methyltransferase